VKVTSRQFYQRRYGPSVYDKVSCNKIHNCLVQLDQLFGADEESDKHNDTFDDLKQKLNNLEREISG
jgi:hypothetical protein